MDIAGKTIWQQAAGDTDRDYSELCLKWDVILNGPGGAARWPDCAKTLSADGRSSRKLTDLKRFSEEMKEGDLVVLRIGTSTIRGVGEIVGPYEWLHAFGDIDGWDLKHVRRVRWFWKSSGSTDPDFHTYALKQGDTTQRLNEGPVVEWLSTLPVQENDFARRLVGLPLPEEPDDISVDNISEFLFDHGVASASTANLLDEIGELTRIAKWYRKPKTTKETPPNNQRSSNKPSEHETVAYLVVPLLRALGWTPQRMAVEWNRVDVALFEQLPRSDESLRVVVEAKKMENSCLRAKSQAMSYAEGKLACHRLIVTDGLRYGVYIRGEVESFGLHAYLNLTRLRHNYSIYECEGAEEALWAMAPEWKPQY